MLRLMLDEEETQHFTTVSRSKMVVSSRSSARGTTMIPRRLTLCVKLTVFIISVTIVVIAIAALKGNNVFNFISLTEGSPKFKLHEISIGDMFFDRFTRSIIFEQLRNNNNGRSSYLTMSLRSKHKYLRSSKSKPSTSADSVTHTKDGAEQVLHLEFDNVNATIYTEKIVNIDCHVVHWWARKIEEVNDARIVLEQCVDMEENWYGGGAISEQRWPLNRVNVPMQPYITRKFNPLNSDERAHFESFLEPYFVSASGTALVFDSFLPLFVSINDNNDKKICFKATFDKPYQFNKTATDQTLLKFTICKDTLAKDVHRRLLKGGVLNRPLVSQNINIFQKPVWSTRGMDVRNINERMLLSYIRRVKNNNLTYSQLFIDGNYSRSPGSVYFDEKRFPHSAQLAMELDSKLPHKNLKIATEVYPLIPELVSSQNFSYLNSRGSDNRGRSEGFLLDMSNKKAVDWFTSQLDFIQSQVKVKGFRFSGGHAESVLNRIGTEITNSSSKANLHPNEITHEYGNIAGRFQGSSFLGSGYRNQRHRLIADAGPFLASWTYGKGLQSVIPTVITYGLMGYPFASAGPIGGINGNSSASRFSLSDRNLYIRWVQLATFLPVMEFSVGPWEYDVRVVNITRNLTSYRQNELWPKHLLPAIKEASDSGIPVIRPLWWVAPLDTTAQFIDCEFLVGDNLLVAPVLTPDQLARQVYLPFGSHWRDELRDGKIHEGGQWLRDYRVEENEIAHFVRVTSSSPDGSTTDS